jgi:hypothetical protein
MECSLRLGLLRPPHEKRRRSYDEKRSDLAAGSAPQVNVESEQHNTQCETVAEDYSASPVTKSWCIIRFRPKSTECYSQFS